MNTTPVLLSASTNGQPIKVVATATPGTLIHEAVTTAGAHDEVYLYATNTSASAVALTVQWGGVTSPDNHAVAAVSVPANSGPTRLTDGLPIAGGLLIRAFAATANVLLITGFVHRVTN